MSAACVGELAGSAEAAAPGAPRGEPAARPGAREELVELFAAEHGAAAAPEALALAQQILRRHGRAVQGILFYGSCLRRAAIEDGVLDFYVVVDTYRAGYKRNSKGTLLAFFNWLMPPSVYYVDAPWQGRRLRMKYNIIAQRDFSRACRPLSLHAIIWARFCQPAALVWARDSAVRERIAADAAEAALTFVGNMLALGSQVNDVEGLWQFGFASTYATELRPETAATIGSIYRAAAERYRRVTELAVSELQRRGVLEGRVSARPQSDVLRAGSEGAVSGGSEVDGSTRPEADASARPDTSRSESDFETCASGSLEVRMDPVRRLAIVRRWRWTAALAKSVYLLRLVKSAFTFGDWLPYAIWKLGRHSGVYVELTERQRRHPLVWGWPVLFRLLRRQTLR